MAAGGRPGAAKAAGDLAGSHGAAAEPDHQQNVAPGGMGQGTKDLLELGEALGRVKTFHFI